MGLFKKFSAPKAKIELKLNEAVFDYKDMLAGKIILDPQEDMSVEELRLELDADKKLKWKKGFSSYSSTSSLGTKKVPVGNAVNLQKGQHYEQAFQINIPMYSRPDPFTEIEVKVKGVAAVKGRPDLTHEVKPAISFPYVIECPRQYGGCGFTTQPLPELIRACPKCGNNLEEAWNRMHADEAREASHAPQRF